MDQMTMQRKSEGSALLQNEHYKLDNERLIKLLGGTDPTTATTENLVRALGLVKGQPISGVKEKYYVWAETLRQEMIAAIGDAAHELATRALREGNTRNARLAAAIGRMVDPINEVFWRDALRAEHMAGDSAGVCADAGAERDVWLRQASAAVWPGAATARRPPQEGAAAALVLIPSGHAAP